MPGDPGNCRPGRRRTDGIGASDHRCGPRSTRAASRSAGEAVRIPTPAAAVRHGVGLPPRGSQGPRPRPGPVGPTEHRTAEPSTHVEVGPRARVGRERDDAERMIDQLRIKTPGPDRIARWLSGGNQQKVVLAKWLAGQAEIFIFDEPTRGIDVAARRDIYDLMNSLLVRGAGIDHDFLGSARSPRHERPDSRHAARPHPGRIRRGRTSRKPRSCTRRLESPRDKGQRRRRQDAPVRHAARPRLAEPRALDPDSALSDRLEPAERARAERHQRHRCGGDDVRRSFPAGSTCPLDRCWRLSGIVLASLLQAGVGLPIALTLALASAAALRSAERPVRDAGAAAAVHRDTGHDECRARAWR